MAMNGTKAMVVRISEQPSPVENMKDLKQLDSVEYSNYLGSLLTIDASSTHMELIQVYHGKAAFNKKKTPFTRKLDLNLRKKLVKCTFGAQLCVVLRIVHFGNYTRNTWKILKCVAGEGWRKSVGPSM
jgi:hypothetical protein